MALTLRERNLSGRGVGAIGTTNRPLPIEGEPGLAEPTIQNFKVRLGFEALPSTQVFSFVLRRSARLRVLRRSDDPYIVHVAVGLQGPDDNRGPGSRPLVQTVGGDSGWHTLTPGRWWLVVACGMPIDISLEIDVLLQQALKGARLAGPADRAHPIAAPERRQPVLCDSAGPPALRRRRPLLVLEPAGGAIPTTLSKPATIELAPPGLPAALAPGRLAPRQGLDARSTCLPDALLLWNLRPWTAGEGWLRDRRGHYHLPIAADGTVSLPLPVPLAPEEVTLEGVDAIPELTGGDDPRLRLFIPRPGSFAVLLQGRCRLEATAFRASS